MPRNATFGIEIGVFRRMQCMRLPCTRRRLPAPAPTPRETGRISALLFGSYSGLRSWAARHDQRGGPPSAASDPTSFCGWFSCGELATAAGRMASGERAAEAAGD